RIDRALILRRFENSRNLETSLQGIDFFARRPAPRRAGRRTLNHDGRTDMQSDLRIDAVQSDGTVHAGEPMPVQSRESFGEFAPVPFRQAGYRLAINQLGTDNRIGMIFGRLLNAMRQVDRVSEQTDSRRFVPGFVNRPIIELADRSEMDAYPVAQRSEGLCVEVLPRGLIVAAKDLPRADRHARGDQQALQALLFAVKNRDETVAGMNHVRLVLKGISAVAGLDFSIETVEDRADDVEYLFAFIPVPAREL